ncbi:MAG: MFS transporter [Rhodoferax sp.]|nr:MFS transporter [Rhodoferax sp.]
MKAATFTPAAGGSLREDASVIALIGLAHAASHFSHLLLPLMFPMFMRDFSLSFAQVGLLMSVFFVVSGLGQALAGFLVDRFGARPLLLVSVALFVLACLLASVAPGYGALMGVAALAGLGNAAFHPVDFTILNQRVSATRLGHAFSVHGLTGNLGWAAAPVFLGAISAALDWRSAYLAAAALYAVVLVVLLWHRDRLQTPVGVRPGGEGQPDPLAFLRLPVVWWCFTYFLLSTMTLAVVQSFSVPILKAMHGVDYAAATLTLTAYMLCGAAGMLMGGFLSARRPRSEQTVALAMTAAAVLLMLCSTGWLGATGTMVALAATGLATGIGGPSRDMMIKRATPRGATGRVYGMVYSGLDVGFALSPLLFGLLMDRGYFGPTLFGAALVLLLAVVTALGVGRLTPGPREAA